MKQQIVMRKHIKRFRQESVKVAILQFGANGKNRCMRKPGQMQFIKKPHRKLLTGQLTAIRVTHLNPSMSPVSEKCRNYAPGTASLVSHASFAIWIPRVRCADRRQVPKRISTPMSPMLSILHRHRFAPRATDNRAFQHMTWFLVSSKAALLRKIEPVQRATCPPLNVCKALQVMSGPRAGSIRGKGAVASRNSSAPPHCKSILPIKKRR